MSNLFSQYHEGTRNKTQVTERMWDRETLRELLRLTQKSRADVDLYFVRKSGLCYKYSILNSNFYVESIIVFLLSVIRLLFKLNFSGQVVGSLSHPWLTYIARLIIWLRTCLGHKTTTFPHKVGISFSVEVVLVFALKIDLHCGKNLTQLFVRIMRRKSVLIWLLSIGRSLL